MCHYVSQHRHTAHPINSSTLALGTQDLMLPYCVLITKVDSNYILSRFHQGTLRWAPQCRSTSEEAEAERLKCVMFPAPTCTRFSHLQ